VYEKMKVNANFEFEFRIAVTDFLFFFNAKNMCALSMASILIRGKKELITIFSTPKTAYTSLFF